MMTETERSLIYLEDKCCYFLSQNLIDCCNNYTQEKSAFNNYLCVKRNADPRKLSKQDAYSKAAEFIAYKWLKEELKIINNIEIDTKVYKPLEKSWQEDVGEKFAVKSTTQRNCSFVRRGTNDLANESWTFQYKNKFGPGGLDEHIFTSDDKILNNKFVIFITLEDDLLFENEKVWIRGMVRLKHLHDHGLFKEPIANKLKGLKKTVYDSDLKELKEKLKDQK